MSQAARYQSSDSDSEHSEEEEFDPPFALKFMFGYLFFIQGGINGIASTMPYIYPELPNYITLSLFSLSNLPFSLKFLTAPFVEKYTSMEYGKRKTWLIICQFITGIIVFFLSFYTQPENAKLFAIMLFFVYFFNSIQNIALDGLCIKELKKVQLFSTLQTAAQGIGSILMSLIFLKFTNLQFSQSIGLQKPITNSQTILVIFTVFFLIPPIIIHFKFKETFLREEVQSTHDSILKVISYYRVHLNPEYTYFRRIFFFILYYQGINFFTAGYNYELVKKGFSRNTMNTIDNINSIFLYLLVFCLGTKAGVLGVGRSYTIELLITVLIFFYLWIWFPITIVPIALTSLVTSFLGNWDFILANIVGSDFPAIGLASMYYTIHASAMNLGKMTFVQTAILQKISWRLSAIIGLIIQVLIIIFISKWIDWTMEGNSSIDSFYHPEEEEGRSEERERNEMVEQG